MKKFIYFCLIIVPIIFLSGCLKKDINKKIIESNVTNSIKDKHIINEQYEVYESKKFGIRVKYETECIIDETENEIIVYRPGCYIGDKNCDSGIQITSPDDCDKENCKIINGIPYFLYGASILSIHKKSPNQSIIDSINSLIKKEGKNPKNCKIIKKKHTNGLERLEINLADSIKLTEKELTEHTYYPDPSVQEFMAKDKKLKELCYEKTGAFAGWGESYFLYSKNSDKYIFVDAIGPEGTAYDMNSIEFIK